MFILLLHVPFFPPLLYPLSPRRPFAPEANVCDLHVCTWPVFMRTPSRHRVYVGGSQGSQGIVSIRCRMDQLLSLPERRRSGQRAHCWGGAAVTGHLYYAYLALRRQNILAYRLILCNGALMWCRLCSVVLLCDCCESAAHIPVRRTTSQPEYWSVHCVDICLSCHDSSPM